MKKTLLIVVVICSSLFISAQEFVKRSTIAPQDKLKIESVPDGTPSILAKELPDLKQYEVNGRQTTYIPLGQSSLIGFIGNSRTYLWTDPNLNSIVFSHRMSDGKGINEYGSIEYDICTDGGTTWNINNTVYVPPGPQPYGSASFPQGVIINPVGNQNPENAWYSYLGAAVTNTNGDWGGTAFGVNPLTQVEPTTPTQHIIESGNGFWRGIPDALTVTLDGVCWYAEPSIDRTSGSPQYTGNIIIGRAELVDDDIEYVDQLFNFLEPGDSFNDSKIAFAPDGLTGYMAFMSDVASNPVPYTNYHPVLIKTTDGGVTWGDPIHVQLGGMNGIESLKSYFSDEVLNAIFGSGYNRNEIYYNMGYTIDIIVDGYGNPHLTGIIAIGDEDGWYPVEGAMATWHVFSTDGGNTWDADALYNNIWFEGDIGGLFEWNRPYAMSSSDGQCLFFSWIDTDLNGAEGNTNPNIFLVAYNSEEGVYSDVDNVTELSLYWFSAFYGTGSHYVFTIDVTPDYRKFEIPFVFAEFTVPGDPLSQMNFYYVDGYTMSCGYYIGIGENNTEDFVVEQNSPNPAVNNTSVLVTTETPGEISFKISNMLGQIVYSKAVNNKALAHTFEFDVSDFESGLYFYTVEIGNKSVTKKMIVK